MLPRMSRGTLVLFLLIQKHFRAWIDRNISKKNSKKEVKIQTRVQPSATQKEKNDANDVKPL